MHVEISDSWNTYLELFNDELKDIYFTEEYVKLYETLEDKARCIVVTDGDFCALMPFLRREIISGYFDFETPYGYGGVICNIIDLLKIKDAIILMISYFSSNHYVAGFIRFHPLLNNSLYFNGITSVIDDRFTIAINLTDDLHTIWKDQIQTKNRNVIKKAEKNGLAFVVDNKFDQMHEFVDLYNSTMTKLCAEDFYYFQDTYYHNWPKLFGDSSFLGLVYFNERLIAGSIIMHSSQYGHYHLSGSDQEYLYLNPNNFMLWETAKELKNRGVKLFHLGGGTDGSLDNSLYRFKQKFNTKANDVFSFAKLIFNQEIYASICRDWEQRNPNKADQFARILLKYRY